MGLHRLVRVLLFAFAFIIPMSASCQSVLLTGDAQVNSAATSTNYGTSTSLAVNSTNSVLLQFNLTDILPAGTTASQVTRARLIVFPNKVTTSGNFNTYAVTGSWDEGTLTYANQPTASTSSSGTGTAKASYRPAFVAVTGLVQGWITTPGSNRGVELKAVGTTNFTIDSKESTATSHQAVLQIDLTGPAGATGPAGPAGPTGPAGAKGATGATGPAGSLTLPYSASQDGAGGTLFSVSNTGTSAGAGIMGTGAGAAPTETYGKSGSGVIGLGGPSSPNSGYISSAGIGVVGQGGPGQAAGTYGGVGGYFLGGDVPYGAQGGTGLVVYGGSSAEAGLDGVGMDVYSGGSNAYAANFYGSVTVNGNLNKSGGSFKIDHPLDPANKYLSHSFVESPDMMNIYNGNVVTDGRGEAVVTMPDWFEALNRDFRYQLTVIGQFAQAIVGNKIANGSFTIRTDKPGVEVSWQVTGIRQDAWANAHRIPIEEEKSEKEKGHYRHPELFGHAGEASVMEMRNPRPKPQQ